MTRLFPNPTARTKMIESTLSLTGMVTVPVLETECRKDHIDMIDPLPSSSSDGVKVFGAEKRRETFRSGTL